MNHEHLLSALKDRRFVICLGINQDRSDAGVALVAGGRVLFAANEERFTRHKHQGGFPFHALEAAFRHSAVRHQDVERVCIAGLRTPPLPVRLVPQLQEWLYRDDRAGKRPAVEWLVDFLAYGTSLTHTSEGSLIARLTDVLREPAVRRAVGSAFRSQPFLFVEHHRAHAAAAWALSGFPETLCLTADGMGDGVSMTISHCRGESIERLWTCGAADSLGHFYEIVTQALGFIPSRHEGKITGLAAHGDHRRIPVPSPFRLVGDRLSYGWPRGRRGVARLRELVCDRHSREDVASWAQHILESNVLAILRPWLQRTGVHRLVLGGGIFANVRLNQQLHELGTEIFVCPNMGDGGLSLGAICAEGAMPPRPVEDVFWGDEFSDADITAALARHGLAAEQLDSIDERVAGLVAQGYIVGRFCGRMEWGPRALGNRSVLARSSDTAVVSRLNRLLQRSDFMPFAPAVLAEDADLLLNGLDGARHSAEFMTLCFDATERMRREHPAVVHVDGTVRAQLVRAAANPSFHRLLQAHKELTGTGMVLNTSFNIHEEPIVRTPDEAIRTFLRAKLDYLALGNHLVRAAHVPEGSRTF